MLPYRQSTYWSMLNISECFLFDLESVSSQGAAGPHHFVLPTPMAAPVCLHADSNIKLYDLFLGQTFVLLSQRWETSTAARLTPRFLPTCAGCSADSPHCSLQLDLLHKNQAEANHVWSWLHEQLVTHCDCRPGRGEKYVICVQIKIVMTDSWTLIVIGRAGAWEIKQLHHWSWLASSFITVSHWNPKTEQPQHECISSLENKCSWNKLFRL